VAVKLRRNGIDRAVREDIRILNLFLWALKPLFSEYTRNSVEAVLAAFSKTIVQEVDMSCERQNLERFRETYAHLGVQTPKPYPSLSSADALVMSFEEGVRFDDRERLAGMQVDFASLMERLILLYVEQMLVTGFFHADPHPGNLLVTEQGGLVLLDFGMVSRIPNATRRAMILTVKAAYDHDFEELIQASKKLGIITDRAPEEDLVILAEEIFRIFDNEQLSASNMQDLAFGIMDALKDYPFKLPQEIVYVMRASSIIEGLGTSFIENYNGIKDVLPVLRANLGRALGGGRGFFGLVLHEFEQLPPTLDKARHLLDAMQNGEMVVRLSPEDRLAIVKPLRTVIQRMAVAGFLVACAFYGATVLPSRLFWLSPLCLVLAGIRILSLARR
jgi:predicted unusual protein kinase regulating ubiquinone biosynthesis (AarF/ABC1/UbiB family)